MAEEKQELAKIEDLPAELASLFDDDPDSGDFDNVADEDLVLPRIKLMQALSPEVVAGTAKMGQLINARSGATILSDIKKPVRFIPVFYWRSRIYYDSDADNMMCRSGNAVIGVGNPGGECAKCSEKNWHNDTPPNCNGVHNWMALFPDLEGDNRLGVLQLQRTSYKVGKKWNQVFKNSPGRIFCNEYRLTSFIEAKKHQYSNYTLEAWEGENRLDKKVLDEDLLLEALVLHKKFRDEHASASIKIDESDNQQPDVPF